jgi:recombination protein RecT
MTAQFPSVRLAATVMLLRPALGGFSVLMLRRSAASSFMPDVFVFPGGAIDLADYDGAAASGWDSRRIEREFRRSLAGPADAGALIRTAVREVAEEASITVDARELHLFSHWITPPSEHRRFSTYFFIARAPHGQEGTADAFETHDAQWIAPEHALERDRRGDFSLVYPTIKHLDRLAQFRDVEEAIEFAQVKPIVTIMPSGTRAQGFTMPSELENVW